MGLFEQDAFKMLRRLFSEGHPLVCLDVGANVGQSARRVCEEFVCARVIAVEPAPELQQELRGLAARMNGLSRIEVVAQAVSDGPGVATLHLTDDPQFASLLKPSEAGRAYHPTATRARGSVEVSVTTIDSLLADRGVARVDVLKIDVQGHELAALRGAKALLADPRLLAVNCEAQIVPEYEGASTFGAINGCLEAAGFVLHQIHELWEHGEEKQHSCLDALWIRREALGWLRKNPTDAYLHAWGAFMDRAIARCGERGASRVAIYGAGRHTREAVLGPGTGGVELVCVIDDDPRRQGSDLTLTNGRVLPVVSMTRAASMGVDGVVLSSNSHEEYLWQSAATLRERGLVVERVYSAPGAWAPEASASATVNRPGAYAFSSR